MRKGCIPLIIIFLLMLCCCVVTILLGYFGFLPYVSSFMNLNSAKDLGIRYTQEDEVRLDKQFGISLQPVTDGLPTGKTISYTGKVDAKFSESDEGLSAQVNKYYRSWKDFPLHDVQIKISDDGKTAEMSGVLDVDRTYGYAKTIGIPEAELQQGLNLIKSFNNQVPFYASGTASVVNNKVDINVTSMEIGRFPVPNEYIQKYQQPLEYLGESVIKSVDGLNIKRLEFQNGEAQFDGTLPKNIKTEMPVK